MLRVIRIQDVCSKIALSRTSLWRLCKQTDFPKPIHLGGRVAGFLEHEIDEWLGRQAAQRSAVPEDL
ncbi:Prophage CP4-57 regulatory protein (AlpA) [compost metagenome]|jgi:prophage regulatory protein